MKDSRVPRSRCLHCGMALDMALDVWGTNPPKPGDATICVECGHLMVFGKKMRLRNPRRAEQIKMAGDPKILAHQKLLAAFKRDQEKKREGEY
jgi:hypothetical protein